MKKGKRVPPNIIDYLTPVALSFWLMDDGSKFFNAGIGINTCGFTQAEVQLLSSSIDSQKFGISSTVYNKTKGSKQFYIIYIPTKDLATIKTIVLPYFHSSMYYKLGL